MGKINIYLQIAEEAERLNNEGLELNAALRKAKEMYLGKEKSHNATDQSMQNDNMQILNDIIAPHEDNDNGEVFDIESGQTIRDL